MLEKWPSRAFFYFRPTAASGNRHAPVKWHAYCLGSETETTMLRDCPTDAKATLALIAVSALCILGWLANLGL